MKGNRIDYYRVLCDKTFHDSVEEWLVDITKDNRFTCITKVKILSLYDSSVAVQVWCNNISDKPEIFISITPQGKVRLTTALDIYTEEFLVYLDILNRKRKIDII
jgi:hypothetical protein